MINNDQHLWLTYTSSKGTKYYITSDFYRKEYYLYKEDKQTKHKSSSPLELYKYMEE